MARYIFIDNYTGYIFGDSADIDGKAVTGDPIDIVRQLDESIDQSEAALREYRHTMVKPQTDESYYLVYRADIDGSDALPTVWDGQDQETIDAVRAHCRFDGYIVWN